jgi:hypothetical protein
MITIGFFISLCFGWRGVWCYCWGVALAGGCQ